MLYGRGTHIKEMSSFICSGVDRLYRRSTPDTERMRHTHAPYSHRESGRCAERAAPPSPLFVVVYINMYTYLYVGVSDDAFVGSRDETVGIAQ